jgi:hypothetical protein
MCASTWIYWKSINNTIEVGMFWSLSRDAVTSLLTMENNIHCTKSHRSSNRSILYPSDKESCMGSNTSFVTFGHVQPQQKSTEAQILKKTVLAVCKMMISTVKMVVRTTSSHQSSFLHY